MSPARSKRTAIPHRRSRAEIVQAACVAVGIVIVTALVIWLMRPGPAGTAGTGGYMNRQPRASAVVIGALLVGGSATWFILMSRRARARAKLFIPVALGMVLVIAVVVGFAWPDGLLRHGVAPPKILPTTTTLATTTTTTTIAGASGATGTTGTTGPTTTTGAAGASTSSTTPSTGTATTTSP
jgi:hypothetical protein